MITVTKQKPFEEIISSLSKAKKVYIIGCGTCATICHTGGKAEVLAMKEKLEAEGKKVTGWMVIPTACDELTREALAENAEAIKAADAVLVMSCAFGVQTVTMYSSDKPVYPALNTLFVGKEETPGHFIEVCMQCGNCVLATTVGICPLVRCAKSLLNGPCGGSVDGKCEVSPDTPCAWQLIYDRLKALGQLDKMDEIVPVRDWSTSTSGGPRRYVLTDESND
jgi:ferredoxin